MHITPFAVQTSLFLAYAHLCACLLIVHTDISMCLCARALMCVFWMCCLSMSMGQVSDLLMDIKRSWPAPHQNPLPWTPTPLVHTHPALCRVRECDLVPIPEEGWTLMTASSDTLRSSEPPSPAGPLCLLGWDPLVHTGRGPSVWCGQPQVYPICTHPCPLPSSQCSPVSRLVTSSRSGCMGLLIRSTVQLVGDL